MYTVYKDRDNTFALELIKNKVSLTTAEMQNITKVGILYNGTEYESGTYPNAFDWSTREDEAAVIFALGPVLAAGRDTKTEVIIYTATDTNGVVWKTIDLKVVDIST
jgi:hypothetical protein